MCSIQFANLSARLGDINVRDLFSIHEGWREDDELNRKAINRAIELYSDCRNFHLFGVEVNGRVVGLIGVCRVSDRVGEIRHIVVHPSVRVRGIGRTMIAQIADRLDLAELIAETDTDAVGFYRRVGFNIESLGEKYPGRERFTCTWRVPI